tara:strand:+ start:177 stop:1100 length:924 start_codon:yes stop_codon:yes gene_type:complete
MIKFLKNILLYLVFIIIILEIIIRVFSLTPEIPQRTIDSSGIQKYKINQSGYYNSTSKEEWRINKFGWAGVSQTQTDTIFSIIGDSYIENFHNPLSCHQGSYLKTLFPQYSFFEAARSGMSFIEDLEVTKYLDTLVAPKKHFIYLNSRDFSESILEIKKHTDRTQFSVKYNKIIKGKLKSAGIKKILYNIKVLHYLYLNYPMDIQSSEDIKLNIRMSNSEKTSNVLFYNKFFNFCINNYNLDNIILVLHPETSKLFIELCKKHNFKIIELHSLHYSSWKFNNDPHWNCLGHHNASKQVGEFIYSNIK